MDRDPRYQAGIDHFNRHDFYAAHDSWEDLWLGVDPGDEKEFLQGLILCAVALHHYSNKNYSGARSRFRLGEEKLGTLPSPFWGVDVQKFLRRMNGTLHHVLTSESPPELNRETIPKLEIAE